MQTNTPWGVNDLDIIIRLSREQNKLQKTYRVTYKDKHNRTNFIGAADKFEVDEKIKELKYHGHQVLDIEILKAKVYIKNPSEAPQGVKLQEGERGGHYYESEGIKNKPEENKPEENKPEENKPEFDIKQLHFENYDQLKQSIYYKGNSIEYDNFEIHNIKIFVPSNDLPNDIHIKILKCSDSFKYSSLKQKPNILFLGKSFHKNFEWNDRGGQKHESEYGGTADYDNNEINIYDDFTVNNIVYHEVGHFVYHKLFSSVNTNIIDAPLKGFESIEDIKKYYKMIEILQTHNVPIDNEHINKILDDVDYVRGLGIMDDMYINKLEYYADGYNTLYAISSRLKNSYTPDLSPFEEKQWKKFRTLQKVGLKANILRNEWHDIWKNEGYKYKEYANRNDSETFAEFYQQFDDTLRTEIITERQNNLNALSVHHPLKFAFFKKYVMKKWLK